MEKTVVSKATLGRIPTYLQLLKDLPEDLYEHISATAIAKKLSLGEVQVRKDLASISCEGKPKVGYPVTVLAREIEEYLFTHECVQDVQVAGIPDEKYGEIVGAFIIKEPGFEDVTEADIRDFCIGSIARYKVPKYVFFVDEFPLTTSGKIQKYKLGEIGLKLLDERRERGEL